MAKIELQETIWFTMQPDCYGGATCDQIEPRWHCYADGDKDSDHQHEPLTLDPRRYPPGTKIVVHEPVCPQCQEVRSPKYPEPETGPIFDAKCDCGFDWDEWTLNEYS